MALFDKIKQHLNIGGVGVQLRIQGQWPRDCAAIDGVAVLTTKSDRVITSIKFELVEDWSTGRGDNKREQTFTLGESEHTARIVIRPGETLELPFNIPFAFVKSRTDQLQDHGGALGALGRMGRFTENEKSEFFVRVNADVEGTAFDPVERAPIRFI